jgi:hypothetical protein
MTGNCNSLALIYLRLTTVRGAIHYFSIAKCMQDNCRSRLTEISLGFF